MLLRNTLMATQSGRSPFSPRFSRPSMVTLVAIEPPNPTSTSRR
jgi:hypothetical protein